MSDLRVARRKHDGGKPRESSLCPRGEFAGARVAGVAMRCGRLSRTRERAGAGVRRGGGERFGSCFFPALLFESCKAEFVLNGVGLSRFAKLCL
jgi:hypothetical protein